MFLPRGFNATIKSAGFTLIELVIVMIVLGVLAATAIPKLASKSGFEDYTVRDQLIARLRLVQLQGMNADPADNTVNACYWLVVQSSCFYHEPTARIGGVCNAPSAVNVCGNDNYNQYHPIAFAKEMLTPANYRFDLQGKLIVNNSVLNAPFDIKLTGEHSLQVRIESEGYIHAQ